MEKQTDRVETGRLVFVGEQDGADEQELKSRLRRFFPGTAAHSAFLVRVRYQDSSATHVALCVGGLGGPQQESIADEIGRIFSSMFNSTQHLDIIFLSTAQENEIVNVCRAFYMGPTTE